MWTVNPLTNRRIKIGGPTWTRLYGKDAEGGRNLPLGKPQTIKQSLAQEKRMPKPKGRRFLEERAYELLPNQGKKQGSSTRGWALDTARGPTQRKESFDKCGQRCFLAKPQIGKRGGFKIGFPICRRCVNGKCECKIDPRGVQAAYRRARQWGHENVASKALSLKRSLGLPKEKAPSRKK